MGPSSLTNSPHHVFEIMILHGFLPMLTQHREVGSPHHRRHTATSQHSLTFIVAAVTQSGIEDGQAPIVVTDATRHRHPVLLPDDVQLDEWPG